MINSRRVPVAFVLVWAGCMGGPAVQTPVCNQWTPELLQTGGQVRLLGAAPLGDQQIQLLLQNSTSIQHVTESTGAWRSTELEPQAALETRGGMALDAAQAPTVVFGAQTVRYARRATPSDTFDAAELPVAGPVLDVAVQADATGTVHVAVVAEGGARVFWVRLRNGAVDVEPVELPAAAARQGPLSRVALALMPDGRSWVFVANNAAIWGASRTAQGMWTGHLVRAQDSKVVELAAVVDGPDTAKLLVRADAQGHGVLQLVMVQGSPEGAQARALDTAALTQTQDRLMAVGLDDQARVRILHARSSTELVQTVLWDGDVMRETVALPSGSAITSVTAVVGPAHTWLVESHQVNGSESQLVTHRCE